MKTYKVDIDTTKPIRQVKQMQQNTTGILDVQFSKDGSPIDGLSCQIFDGENELSTTSYGDCKFGCELDIGEEIKNLKIVAGTQPTIVECSASRFVGGTQAAASRFVPIMQIPQGEYKVRDFYISLEYLVSRYTTYPTTFIKQSGGGTTNLQQMRYVTNPTDSLVLYNTDNKLMSDDDIVTVTDATVIFGTSSRIKKDAEEEIDVYAAIKTGEPTEGTYSIEIKPDDNAAYDGTKELDGTPATQEWVMERLSSILSSYATQEWVMEQITPSGDDEPTNETEG